METHIEETLNIGLCLKLSCRTHYPAVTVDFLQSGHWDVLFVNNKYAYDTNLE